MNRRFHEWPLVVFTWVATAGAGLLTASALLDQRLMGLWGLGAVGAGFLFSTAHLGRPMRAPMALRRAGRSPLSNEVLVGGFALVSGIVWLLGAAWSNGGDLGEIGATGSSRLAASARMVTAALAPLFLLAVGLVYRLPGQQTWRGAATIGPLLAGLALGAASAAMSSVPWPAWLPRAAWLLLLADGAASAIRWYTVAAAHPDSLPVHPQVFARRHALMAGRIALFDCLPALLLSAGGGAAVAVMTSMGIGLLLDRVAFYGLARRSTTDADLARAEMAIGVACRRE